MPLSQRPVTIRLPAGYPAPQSPAPPTNVKASAEAASSSATARAGVKPIASAATSKRTPPWSTRDCLIRSSSRVRVEYGPRVTSCSEAAFGVPMRLPLPVFRAVSCCADFRDVRRLLFGEWYQLDVDDVTTRTLRY